MGVSLSFSAAQKYLLSPRAWFLHYLLRLRPEITGSALIFGSALDAGFNFLLEYKKQPLILNYMMQAPKEQIFTLDSAIIEAKRSFKEEFETVSPEAIKYSKADGDTTSLPEDFVKDPLIPIEWYCLLYKGYILIEEYATQVLPRIQEVYEVQKEISMTNEMGDTFTGIIDIVAKIDDKILIVDNKSASVKYAQDSVANSEQLASYYEAMRESYKLDGACYIVIQKKLRKEKKPRVQIDFVFGSIDENLIAKTFMDYENVLDGIKNGRFECTPEKCCATPWGCNYRTYCESGGKDIKGLKYHEKSK